VLFLFVFSFYLGVAQNTPPEITATGNQNYCLGDALPIVTNVSITDADPGDTTLQEVRIQISEGYVAGLDNLSLSGTHPNINPVWSTSIGELLLQGPATLTEFEDAILDVVFTTGQTVFSSNRSFSINLGNANFLPATGHYYFYVEQQGISWTAARNAAAAQTFFGLQGYLATITSPEEAQLTGEQSLGTGWIGASDAANEGTWLWVTGPEAGTPFWQGTVSGTPIDGEFSFWNSGEPNNLGDEDYAHITDPSIGFPGSWNDLDPNGNPDPSNPYHPRGYIVEFGGLPGEPTINLSASSTIVMPQGDINDDQVCQGETLSIDLNANTDDILWYDGPTSSNIVNTGNTLTTTFNTTTEYWIVSRFSGCTSDDRQPLTITVNPPPDAIDITIQQCDDASNDGISEFRLSNYEFVVANNITANRDVTFFEDVGLTIPIDASSYTNSSNNQVIYANVLDTSTNCTNTAEVTLNVSTSSDDSFTLEQCDDEVEDGITTFDLQAFANDVLTGFPTTAQARFYETFEDAVLIRNPLPSSYSNQIPDNDSIYVRISDGNDCLGINEVALAVLPLPALRDDETVYYCLNTFPSTITIDGGIVNDIPNNYYYNWSTGETTIAIQINEPGIYTVDVTEVDGCTNRRTIEVVASNTATIETIQVEDGSDNNTVTVTVSGEGDYQLALDFENGPYQDSNVFQNVQSGLRTVYVRDKNGCGTVAQQFPVIGFPKYFTPNGDGQNDFWTIDGFDEEFLLNSTVSIFNRHGKLLTVLSAVNPSWDGRYNGALMPTDDYWFSVQLQDGRTFTKHFTLKR